MIQKLSDQGVPPTYIMNKNVQSLNNHSILSERQQTNISNNLSGYPEVPGARFSKVPVTLRAR